MKILAIDGNSILNRAFYGVRPLSTKSGIPTNAVYGFINILNKLKTAENPDGVVVAFDLKFPTFRHLKYAEYKAGRRPMPEDLAAQFPLIKEYLTFSGHKVLECKGFEADDILGSVAAVCENSGNECVIATGDRDALQLISESTRVVLAVTKAGHPETVDYTKEKLFETYGLTPDEMIELKAVMGDTSDNIKGVAGIGEKGATDLIKAYHSIDYIYENLDNLDIKDSVRAKLAAGKESAYFSRFLGTISKEAPVGNDISAFCDTDADIKNLSVFMTRLELFKLMENMGISPDVPTSAAADISEKIKTRKVSVEDFNKSGKSYSVYVSDGMLAVATDGEVTSVTFDGGAFDEAELLKEIFESDAEKTVYDLKNLYKSLKSRSIKLNCAVFDTLLASYLASPSDKSYDLSRLQAEYSLPDPECDAELTAAEKGAVMNIYIAKRLITSLESGGQITLLYDIEIPLAFVLADMETEGFSADYGGLKALGITLGEKADTLKNEIYSLTGEEFNLNSPKQLGTVLFEKLGLPSGKKTKNGYSTSAEVLESLRDVHPAVEKLLEYRQLTKLKSTYCDGLCAAVGSDGKIHSTFNQTETRTGRISSLEPNLQNIPVRTEIGKQFRKYFTAKDGFTLVDADYSQIELRVLAAVSGDKAMCEAFNSGADIHRSTAAEIFKMPFDMVTPLMRSRAKAVNFGIVYGIGAFSLSKDTGVTRKEADEYIKNYLATYSGVDAYMKNLIETAKRDGFVTTLFGRRRYIPELSASNHMLRAFGERVARNAPIQGTAADIIKIAMIRVAEKLREIEGAKLILQVHDELIVECRSEDAAKVSEILKTEMENATNLPVKLIADVHTGKTWYEAKG